MQLQHTTFMCHLGSGLANSNYHSLDDEVWSEIMDEDYQIDYDNLGNRSYDNVEEEVINDDIQDGNCSSDLIS